MGFSVIIVLTNKTARRECFCGDRLVESSQVKDTDECNIPCAGNRGTIQQICGAGNRLNVYYTETL